MSQIKTNRVLTLMLTHACNLNCVYCFEKHKSGKSMSLETAQEILRRELYHYMNFGADSAEYYAKEESERIAYLNSHRIAIELFGGEPLTKFPLIKQIYEWVKTDAWIPDGESRKDTFHYIFQITTNGTLLNDEIRHWLTERKEDFRIVLSVDGTEGMQAQNRGCRLEDLPIAFVKETWEKSYFKLTISPETLHHYAEGLISLTEKGYRIASSLAEGQTWKKEDIAVYEEQLRQIGEYFLQHPNVKLEHPFNFTFIEYLEPRIQDTIPRKNCGAGTTIDMYDTDGVKYPCHLFLPMVHGNHKVLEDVKGIDWKDPQGLIDDECSKCPALKVCRTCYGYNYSERGGVSNRDKGMCGLRLVEAQSICKFQLKYFTERKELSDHDLLCLKGALACYKNISSLYIDENGKIKRKENLSDIH